MDNIKNINNIIKNGGAYLEAYNKDQRLMFTAENQEAKNHLISDLLSKFILKRQNISIRYSRVYGLDGYVLTVYDNGYKYKYYIQH